MRDSLKVVGGVIAPVRDYQRPHSMFRFDDNVRHHVRPCTIDPLDRRQREPPPQRHSHDLRRRGRRFASQTDVKPAKPERGCHELECPEHIPCECLLKTFILECAESCGRTSESVRMVGWITS